MSTIITNYKGDFQDSVTIMNYACFIMWPKTFTYKSKIMNYACFIMWPKTFTYKSRAYTKVIITASIKVFISLVCI